MTSCRRTQPRFNTAVIRTISKTGGYDVFCAPMNRTKAYTRKQGFLSISLMLLLLWLTVSVPFVYAAQQKVQEQSRLEQLAKMSHQHTDGQSSDDEDQSCNPFGNNTEEKAPSSGINSLSEEYLHSHTDDIFHAVELFLSHSTNHTATEYISFHGELLCPPPNQSV